MCIILPHPQNSAPLTKEKEGGTPWDERGHRHTKALRHLIRLAQEHLPQLDFFVPERWNVEKRVLTSQGL